jgi:predicted CXXCH cytochrome family protein
VRIQSASGRTIRSMGELIGDRKHLHGPVQMGECSACHNVHGARNARLLRERFAESFYADFDVVDYALCFTCHDPGLVTEKSTEALTNFRNGALNLHYVHVNREQRGRTCRACHEIHGSNLPFHVAESVPFEGSSWALPINFQITETGGSCAPGCHAPMSYQRPAPAPPPTGGNP